MDKFKVESFSWDNEKGWVRNNSFKSILFSRFEEAEDLLYAEHAILVSMAKRGNSFYSNISEPLAGGPELGYFTYDLNHNPKLVRIVRINEDVKMDEKLKGIALNVTVLADVDIENAYNQVKLLSERLGGVQIETKFNGVKMLYSGQTEGLWEAQYAHGVAQDYGTI